jgi:hypothetical protein
MAIHCVAGDFPVFIPYRGMMSGRSLWIFVAETRRQANENQNKI